MSEVFISRTSADDDFVAELRQRLTAQGVPVWVDSRNLRGGDTLAPEIERAITAASHVVVVLSTATVNSEWVSREVVKALEVKGARADYRVVPVLRPGIKHTALRLWFPEEPIAVRVEEGPLGLIEAMPELLAALGVREPTDHEPLDTPAARPVAELVLRLSDPRMLAGEGTRRAAATARLVYDPADGGPEIESERFAFIAPLGPIEADDLTWYLERYYRWPIGVFRERAASVEAQLPGWGRKLYMAAVEHEKAQQVFGAVEAQTDPLAGRVAAVAARPGAVRSGGSWHRAARQRKDPGRADEIRLVPG